MRVFEAEAFSIDKVGSPGGDAFLVTTPEHTLLYDSGFAVAAPALVDEVAALLDGRTLDYQFLSHSHYDHVSGSPWVTKRWPEALIFGSAHAAQVFERPGARKTMQNLNSEVLQHAQRSGYISISSEAVGTANYTQLDDLKIDEIVRDGSIIDMGSATLNVIESPGHTHCTLMLWCPEKELLFGSESLGVMINEHIVAPVCLTGYHDCLNSIAKAQALHPKHILVSHRHVVSDEEAKRYLNNALHWTEKTAHLVWECHSIGMSKDVIAAMLKEIFYGEHLKEYQPEAAFDLNNGYLIDQLLAEKGA